MVCRATGMIISRAMMIKMGSLMVGTVSLQIVAVCQEFHTGQTINWKFWAQQRTSSSPNIAILTFKILKSSALYWVRILNAPRLWDNWQAIFPVFMYLGTLLRGKTAVLLDFVQMRGRESPAQIFGTFSEVHFWSIKLKGVYFLQNANNLNLQLFFFWSYI